MNFGRISFQFQSIRPVLPIKWHFGHPQETYKAGDEKHGGDEKARETAVLWRDPVCMT